MAAGLAAGAAAAAVEAGVVALAGGSGPFAEAAATDVMGGKALGSAAAGSDALVRRPGDRGDGCVYGSGYQGVVGPAAVGSQRGSLSGGGFKQRAMCGGLGGIKRMQRLTPGCGGPAVVAAGLKG